MSYELAPCLFCAEAKNLTKESRGDRIFVACGNCQASAVYYQWQHPISQSQVCMICTTKDSVNEQAQAHL
jgi:hypothetical protein